MPERADDLAGRVVWVTGSSRGLGRVVAAHLAGLGARLAVHGSTPTSARAFNEADFTLVSGVVADEGQGLIYVLSGNSVFAIGKQQ